MTTEGVEAAIEEGLLLLDAGDTAGAIVLFERCVAESPDHFDALNLLGVALFKQGETARACELLERAVAVDSSSADAFYNLAEVEAAFGDPTKAMAHYRRAAQLDPSQPLPWHRLSDLAFRLKDEPTALEASEQVLLLRPDDPKWMIRVGQLLLNSGALARSIALLERAVAMLPEEVDGRILLYKARAATGDYAGAILVVEQTLLVTQKIPRIYKDHAMLLRAAGRIEEAVEAGKEYVRRFSEDGESHFTLGHILQSTNELGAAGLAFGESIHRRPDDARGYLALGETLLSMGRLMFAREQIEQAIELDPTVAMAHIRLAVVRERMGKREEAIESLKKALEITPGDVEVMSLMAMLWLRHGSHSEAAEIYRRCLELAPNKIGVLTGYGCLLSMQGDTSGSWTYLQRAIAAEPDNPLAIQSSLLFSVSQPGLTPEEQADLHRRWGKSVVKTMPPPFDKWSNDRSPDRKLRIGYVSADMRGHSVAYFFEPLLSAHRKTEVEVHVFDATIAADIITKELTEKAEFWHRIVGAGTDRVVEMVRDMQIDILVDLGGHTGDSRIDVFIQHPAPIQVSYLGYPSTTGLPAIDYRFTDAVADPPGAEAFHSEQLVRLPGGFLCFRPTLPWDDVETLPAGLDRPITFTSFNAVNKINPKVLSLWSRVLAAVPDAQLLLKANGLADPQTRQNLSRGLIEAGVPEGRFEFVNRTVTYRDHLKTYHRGDIGLDTFPYNGTTTTCEALWMGVPVIALSGDRHASRVSQSILTSLGMEEFIAQTEDDYVRLAVKWATDRRGLIELRKSMRAKMLGSRLMNGPAHAEAVEAAYRKMWHTWCNRTDA